MSSIIGMSLLGIGILIFTLFVIIGLLMWPVAIVRTAINKDFSVAQKVIWILAELFIFPVAYCYMIFVEKSLVWKILGCLFLLEALACPFIYLNLHDFSKKIKLEANLTGAGLCEACASSDPQQSNECLGHLSRHLVLVNSNNQAYCSSTPITPELAKDQMVKWCKEVGPNYPFPSPLWRTMYMALSEKYACQAKVIPYLGTKPLGTNRIGS